MPFVRLDIVSQMNDLNKEKMRKCLIPNRDFEIRQDHEYVIVDERAGRGLIPRRRLELHHMRVLLLGHRVSPCSQ